MDSNCHILCKRKNLPYNGRQKKFASSLMAYVGRKGRGNRSTVFISHNVSHYINLPLQAERISETNGKIVQDMDILLDEHNIHIKIIV